jgi:hypothetical protein
MIFDNAQPCTWWEFEYYKTGSDGQPIGELRKATWNGTRAAWESRIRHENGYNPFVTFAKGKR